MAKDETMVKFVRYKGCTLSHLASSDPKNLSREKMYEVIREETRGEETYYILKGVEGSYPSEWFERITLFNKNKYVVVASKKPKIGQNLKCYKLTYRKGEAILTEHLTSIIEKVVEEGANIYSVETFEDDYIVQVG